VKDVKLANIKVYDAASTLLDVVSVYAPVKELTRINVLSMVSEIFADEATLANFKLKPVTVGIVANEVRYTLAVLENEKVLGAELAAKITNSVGHVETLLGAETELAKLDLGQIKVQALIDTIIDITEEFIDETEESGAARMSIMRTATTEEEESVASIVLKAIKKLSRIIISENATLSSFKFNGSSTVNELYDCVTEAADKKLPEKVQKAVDIVLNIYGDVRLFRITSDGWTATKAIEIANTLEDIFKLVGIRSEYKFYELLENNGVQTTVGDFVDNANATVKAITDKVSDINYLNDIVSDLYFKKAFGETSTVEKAAVFGTYAGAGVIAYIVAPAKVREAIGEKTIADFVAPEKIAKNAKQQEVLEELFDFKLVTVLDVIEGKTAKRTAAKTLVENIQVGDVVGMFSRIEKTETGWTYGSETFDELATEIFEIEFTDVVSAMVKEIEFTDVFDYKNVTVGKTEGLLLDATGIVNVHTGKELKVTNAAISAVASLLKRDTLVQNVKLEATVHPVVDALGDVVEAAGASEAIVTASEELVKVVLSDVSLKDFSQYINKEAEFADIYDSTENLVEKITNKRIKDGSALAVVENFVKTKLDGITIGNCKTEVPAMLKAITTYEVIDLAADVADTFEKIPAGVTENAEKLLKEIAADRTLVSFKFNKNGKFVNMYDYALEAVELATGKTLTPGSLVDEVIIFVKEVFANVTLGNCGTEFMNAVKGIKIHRLAEFAYDLVTAVTNNGTVLRMAGAAADAVKRFVTDDSTVTSLKTQNLSLGAINDTLADILFDSDMETLLGGTAADKAKAYVIYYLDANAGAALYMISREKVTSLLGETTLGIAPSIAGKTPAISEMIKEVKINDILRVSVDKFTGKTDKSGNLAGTVFIETYFGGATIGDVIEVFLPEKLAANKLVSAVLDAKLTEVYEVVRGRKTIAQFGKDTVGTLTLGDMLGIAKIRYNGNEITLYEYAKAIQLNDIIACVLPRFVSTEEYTLMGLGEIVVKYFTVDGGYIDAAMGDATLADALDAVLPSKIGENVIGKALYNIKFSDFYFAVRGYASMEELLSDALANISAGEVLGFEKGSDGAWYKDGKAKFVYTPNAEKLVLTDSVKYVLFGLLNDVMGVKAGKFLTKVGEENYLTAIKNGNVEFGEVFGRTYDEVSGKWLDENGKAAIPLWNALYSLNVKSFDNAVHNILEVAGDIKLGELLLDVTYDEANGCWIYNPNGTKAFADGKLFSMIEANLFKMTANSLLKNGALNVENIMNVIFENIYLGNALDYKVETVETAPEAATDKAFTEIVSAYGKLPAGEYKAQDGVYYVQTAESYYFLVENAAGTYDKKTVSVTDARKMEYNEYGDVPFAVSDLDYVWTDGGTQVSTIYNLIANTDLGGIVNGGGIGLIDDLGWLTISDINLGIDNAIIDLIEDTPLCKIDSKIDEIVLADLLKYNKTEVTDLTGYTEVAGVEGVMVNASNEYVKAAGDKWFVADNTLAARKHEDGIATSLDYTFVMTEGEGASAKEIKLLQSLFASLSIHEVTTRNGFGNIMDSVNYMTLAEILGDSDPLFDDDLFKKLKDTVIKDLATEIKAMELGDIMNYTLTEVDVTGYTDVDGIADVKKTADGKYARMNDDKWYEAIGSIAERKAAASETITVNDYVYVWKNGGAKIDITEAVFASVTIGDVTNGTGDILDRMFWLTAKELLGNNISDSSTIFNLIADKPIKNIESAINELYVGDLMGYTRGEASTTAAGEYKWYKDAAKTTEVKGFENIMANMTVGGLGTTDFDDKIKGVKLKEVLTIPAGNILNAVLDDDTTLGNAPGKIQDKMTRLTMSQFMQYGVLTIDDGTQIKLNTLFTGDAKNWTELTMSEFISALINKIPD
ncbi:MAG: hypothetical protein MRZ91_00020, partial [Christensenellaceae bacterium]|nr:hypothetical protein [Christensenellaceae bacterium]